MSKNSLVNTGFKSFQGAAGGYTGLYRANILRLDSYILKAGQNFYISSKHYDLFMKYLKRKLKKSGLPRFLYPLDFPLTKKPSEVRMGKGKGAICDWSIPIKKGMYFFMLQTIKTDSIQRLLVSLQGKLPIKTSLQYSSHLVSEFNKYTFFFSINCGKGLSIGLKEGRSIYNYC